MLNKQVGGELGMAEKTVQDASCPRNAEARVTSVAELMVVLQKAEVPQVAKPGTKV